MINEFGKRIWSHMYLPYTVERAYSWVDSVLVIDESKNREIIKITQFSTFDFTYYIEWSQDDYKRALTWRQHEQDLLVDKQDSSSLQRL